MIVEWLAGVFDWRPAVSQRSTSRRIAGKWPETVSLNFGSVLTMTVTEWFDVQILTVFIQRIKDIAIIKVKDKMAMIAQINCQS